jgi:hypothetical protein
MVADGSGRGAYRRWPLGRRKTCARQRMALSSMVAAFPWFPVMARCPTRSGVTRGSPGSGLCARLHPSATQRSGWRAPVIGELPGMDRRIRSLQNRTTGGHQRECRTKGGEDLGKDRGAGWLTGSVSTKNGAEPAELQCNGPVALFGEEAEGKWRGRCGD